MMGIASFSSLTLVFYLSKIMSTEDFYEYSFFLLVMPIIQAILSLNSYNLISIRIVKGFDQNIIIVFFSKILIINAFLLLIILLIIKIVSPEKISNTINYIYLLLILIGICINDIHGQILLSKEKSIQNYSFYALERFTLLMSIYVIYKINAIITVENYLKIQFFIIFIAFILRMKYYNSYNKSQIILLKNSLNFCHIRIEYLLLSLLLYVVTYASSNIDRFISTIFLSSNELIIYTKIFVLLSGSNMLAQAIIQVNFIKFYNIYTKNKLIIFEIKKQSRIFLLIGLILSIITASMIILISNFFDYILVNEHIYIYILCSISSIILIKNKAWGLYLDYTERQNYKVYAGTASIISSIIFYYLLKDLSYKMYIPGLILILSTLIYTKIIEFNVKKITMIPS